MPQTKEQDLVESKDTIENVYTIFIHNDNINTFEHVINCLLQFCGHSYEQATQVTYLIHFKGKCDVKRGNKSDMIKILNNLIAANLTATIEN